MKRAIQSVLEQTYYELECIVVDDASEEQTEEAISSFEDDRLRYFRHEKNKGASAARNTGIRHSKGELIAFLDDDDEWMIDKLEKQVELLIKSKQNIGLIYSWMSYMKGQKELYLYNPKLKGHIFKDMLDKQAIGNSSTLLVRRQVIEKIGGFDESLPRGNDGDFIRRVCRKYEVDYVPEVLVKVYTEHGSERISDQRKKSIKNSIKSQKLKLQKFPRELNYFPEKKSRIYIHIGNHYDELRQFNSALRFYFKAIIASPRNKNIYKLLFFKMISFSMYR